MTVNMPLLRKAVAWAEAEAAKPEEECQWWQEEYEKAGDLIGRTCGTCYCIAGYVLHINGFATNGCADEQAAALLGIDVEDHNGCVGLFNAENTIADIRRIAEGIAEEAGGRL